MGTLVKTAVAFCVIVLIAHVLQAVALTLLMLLTDPTFILLTAILVLSYLPLIILLKLSGILRALILFTSEEFKRL